MEYKVRLGNTINFKWPILTNGKAESLEGRELTLIVTDPLGTSIMLDYYVEDNYIITSLLGKLQTVPGKYTFALWENKGKASQRVVDLCAPFLVVRDTHDENIKHGIAQTFPSGELFTALKGDPGDSGKSAYEIAVEQGFVGTEEEWLESLKGNYEDIEHELNPDSEKPISSAAVAKALKDYQKNQHLSIKLSAPNKSLPGASNTIYYEIDYNGVQVTPETLDVEIGEGNWESVTDFKGYIDIAGVDYPCVITLAATYKGEEVTKSHTISSALPIFYGEVPADFSPTEENVAALSTTLLPLVTTTTLFDQKYCFAVPQDEPINGVFDDNDIAITSQFTVSNLTIGGAPYYVLLLKEPACVTNFGLNLQGTDSSAIYGIITNRILQLEEDPIIWTDEQS